MSDPRKSRKRTREIRERARTTGTGYTEAMRANDANQAAQQPQPSYQYVDRHNRGWHTVTAGRYRIDWAGLRPGRPDDSLTREELEAEHGPLRPVGLADPTEVAALVKALTAARRLAAGSVLVAAHRLVEEYSSSTPGGVEGGSLWAGSEGSWESAELYRLARTIGAELAGRPRRYSEECVTVVVAVLRTWARGPRYVEVGGTLAAYFGHVASKVGGWAYVADRPLQLAWMPGRHSPETIEAVQGYLMSQATDPTWDD